MTITKTTYGKLPAIQINSPDGAQAIVTFNDRLRADERVDLAMLTVGEGLTLLRKRA